MGYADPSAQIGLGTREPTDDLSPTGYLDPSAHERPRQQGADRGPRGGGGAPRGGLNRNGRDLT